jgi:two-component system, chemotaxis family, chemotaxis protein CheY
MHSPHDLPGVKPSNLWSAFTTLKVGGSYESLGETMTVDMSMPVLIVDDYRSMLKIVHNLLNQIGFDNVDEASDGAQAISKLRTKRYGLVISDWNMEPVSGFELLQHVRSDDGLKNTPFIMVTAESKADHVVAAKQAGVSNYILKPFNSQTLRQKIEAVLGTLN